MIGGGGAGIGRSIVRSCAAAGATVAVADVDAVRATEAADELRAAGHVSHALSGDVRSGEQLEDVIVGAAERLGGRIGVAVPLTDRPKRPWPPRNC
ncbi:SDR family NAD(P)-dependent oxidoreductase [Streptomyces sp. NPDC059818]|uniref:SDR family NAD(P)-dependent oxidoreductase n=1 Tax=Streptomyces sp. NPDC059818 TaxID=3346962 RepID=UPI00364C8DCC